MISVSPAVRNSAVMPTGSVGARNTYTTAASAKKAVRPRKIQVSTLHPALGGVRLLRSVVSPCCLSMRGHQLPPMGGSDRRPC